jgi:hypothetical protein
MKHNEWKIMTATTIDKQEITMDHVLMKDPQFFKIKEILEKLEKAGVLGNMAGNCISACETMQQLLFQVGIESSIIECQVILTRDGTEKANDILFIGYDDKTYKGEIDTHVVLLTKGRVPLLIDISLAHVLPADHSYVIERLNNTNSALGTYSVANITLGYSYKENIKLHTIHQKNLLGKYLDEQKKIDKIKFIEKLAYWAIGVSAFDVVLNGTILTIKLISGT